ncbi:PilN domain-containing protein [Clostridium cylindrosporum]|uniref:Uncharacterized protein n=1 Tax=Clostridium cylindrosporum DSM 605 TaxID=1121307 RepID=A0A0J8DAF6_CLOCY|nr:PilN domain-containing protein [Clostridium cylindrosporum]KMT21288.1 hypothetical protein CLCY_2c00480 [Clostridium cylindrosporum DSM 605]
MFRIIQKDINFLDAYSLREKKSAMDIKIFGLVILVEIFLLAGISGFMFGIKKVTEYKNIELINNIKSLEHIKKDINEVRYEGKLLKTKKLIKDEALEINEVTYNTLTIFEEVLSSDMAIENMTMDMKSINFIVRGAKEENFAQLINNMESSGLFSKVQITAISSKDEEGNRKASVNAEIIRK